MEALTKKPKTKPFKVEDMTKEQLRQAIHKKRECNSKALTIVESLIETHITEEYFLNCLPDINQSHLEDIIEERSILHLCGYPVCANTLSVKEIPKQKYRISTKTNKVYDITARKHFCSNKCYESCIYIKQQMLTSPLWFREYENIPKFQLLPLDVVRPGSLGLEVDVSLIEKVHVKIEKNQNFTSINDFTSASLLEIAPDKDDSQALCKSQDERIETSQDSPFENSEKPDSDLSNTTCKLTDEIKKITLNLKDNNLQTQCDKQPTHNSLNNDCERESVENSRKKIKLEHSETKRKLHKKQPLVTAVTIEVEKCLAEWFTLDTIIFLFGEEKVKEMVADKGEAIREYLNNYAKGIFYSSNSYDQYQLLCRKLNLLELEDKKLDAQTLQRDTKPLPDYSILQEESKRLQLKVKAFLAGATEIPEPDAIDKEPAPTDDSNLTKLPLVENNALRRNIVCDHLNKVLPDLLRSLGMLSVSLTTDVRYLVNTFKLTANNVMFKPIQWVLIAIIIIKLLSLRDGKLKCLLEQQTAYQHMQLLLLSYKQDGGYLDRLILWLTDVDRLLDTSDTQLTLDP